MDLELADRTALVTGSWRGTGSAIAATLAAEGSHVLVHGFEPGQPDAVVESITAAGGRATGVVADLGTDAGAAALAERAETVDVLINNYGAPGGSSWDSNDRWEAEWNDNVLTGVRTTQLCIPAMRSRGWGRVVFLGTVGSRMPGSNNPGYYAAKAGMHAMVRTLAIELRGTGVTANLVSPGLIATTEIRDALTRRYVRSHPDQGAAMVAWDDVAGWALQATMGNLTERFAEPADIARVVAFVASGPAWHINGADIAVDGGAVDAQK